VALNKFDIGPGIFRSPAESPPGAQFSVQGAVEGCLSFTCQIHKPVCSLKQCVHTGVLTVGVKAGVRSRYANWLAFFSCKFSC